VHASPGSEREQLSSQAELDPGVRGQVSSAISSVVVKLFATYLGRGPTKARTVLTPNLISVVLEDTLTRAERRLVEIGRERFVVEMRRVMQDVMRDDLVAAIESITGRRVLAFLSDHQADPDYAVESFVLEPLAAPADTDEPE
jgi:uncharacterized protein YbcI